MSKRHSAQHGNVLPQHQFMTEKCLFNQKPEWEIATVMMCFVQDFIKNDVELLNPAVYKSKCHSLKCINEK